MRRSTTNDGRVPTPTSSPVTCHSSFGFFDRMAAELVAECGQHFGGEGLFLARDEALHERERDHRRGYVGVDRGLHRPAALARVLDIPLDRRQVGVLAEGVFG